MMKGSSLSRRNTATAALVFWAVLIGRFLFAGAQNPAAGIADFAGLEKAIASARAAVQTAPGDAGTVVELARLLMMGGKLDEAETALQRSLDVHPKDVPSLVQIGRLYRLEYRFEKERGVIDRAKALDPAKAEVRLLEASFALDQMDFQAARTIYAEVADKTAPPAASAITAAALCGLAEVAYWENRFAEAEALIARCLAADAEHSRAYFLRSLIHRIRQENEKWAVEGRKAVTAGPFDADARANLSNILMRGEKKLDEGYAEAKLALRINPFCHLAHTYIGNGWTPVTYREGKASGDPDVAAKINAALEEGDAVLLARSLDRAEAAFGRALGLAPSSMKALIGADTVRYLRRDYDGALDGFFKALAIDPDYGLAHYGAAQSLLRKKDLINVRFAEVEKRFTALDAPEPPFLRDVFINYAGLDPDLQKILRLSVRPLRAFLKLAKDKGATFYLTPFHKLQSEAPGMADLKGQRTFDLRLWDDVKGLGGRNALSGEDWERDVKYLRFNVVAHEFAHQIHGLVPAELKAEIRALFTKAKAERLTLDFYADFNEMEYFATGVEAYVSEDKLADQKVAYGHTRRELREKDPDLSKLIERFDKVDTLPASGRI
jgi:tetratricopeptide (TPR) repeat protein